jgi:fanconi-associated nuclease 1
MDRFLQRSRPATSREPLANASLNSPKKSQERPTKRVKVTEVKDSEDEDDDEPIHEVKISPSKRKGSFRSVVTEGLEGETAGSHVTPIESALPEIKVDEEAIEEYESLKASQVSEEAKDDSAASRLDNRNWVRGKSSIYVDAFNLALDTVLEEESHLFDDKERKVFEQWRSLSYEAQYL